nr:leucine-rich repeat domain-containing protein [Oscillospiraceae bacterium]
MNMKKLIAGFTSAAIAACLLTGIPTQNGFAGGMAIEASAAAKDFVIEEMETDDGTLNVLTDYRGKGGDITIPAKVDWIGEEAFGGNDSVRSVTFPVTEKFPTD